MTTTKTRITEPRKALKAQKTREPADRYCPKCGARPGDKCRTAGGNHTTMHANRRDGPAKQGRLEAMHLECWRIGWRAGATMMSTAQAHELSTTYLSPQNFLAGWTKAREITECEDRKARQRLMAPPAPS